MTWLGWVLAAWALFVLVMIGLGHLAGRSRERNERRERDRRIAEHYWERSDFIPRDWQ